MDTDDEIREAIRNARSEGELARIPQKPMKVKEDLYVCSHCLSTFIRFYQLGFEVKLKYCGNCGTALDWSDVR